MSLLETVKKAVETATGWQRPTKSHLPKLVVQRKPRELVFGDDGVTPNHPHWPLIIYHAAVRSPEGTDPAAVLEDLFESNGWINSWRGQIYDFLHYHSRIHESLGVARGHARVRFGGRRGRTLKLKFGDVVIIPAGTGHQCLSASDDFLVVGAYPSIGVYDECRTSPREHARALKTIQFIASPPMDPIYGSEGPLLSSWRDVPHKPDT
jgi:uncharacterized protein YjlB